MEKINWKTEQRKISELTPAEYNPRLMTEKESKDLSTSLERFSLADPIVINTNNRIIGGHMRINILKQSGDHTVDVRVPSRELSQEEEKELNLRLNKNLGQWDFDELANFDEDMLNDVGFTKDEINNSFGIEKEDVSYVITEMSCSQCQKFLGISKSDKKIKAKHYCSYQCQAEDSITANV